jgi:hypothetical protein
MRMLILFILLGFNPLFGQEKANQEFMNVFIDSFVNKELQDELILLDRLYRDTVFYTNTNFSIGDGVYIRLLSSKGEVNHLEFYNKSDSIIKNIESQLKEILIDLNFTEIILINKKSKFIISTCQKSSNELNDYYSFLPRNFDWMFKESNYGDLLIESLTDSEILKNERININSLFIIDLVINNSASDFGVILIQ